MRNATTDEVTVLNDTGRRVNARVEVQNASGTWKELTNLSGSGFANLDFLLGLDWGTDFDQPTWNGTVALAAEQLLNALTGAKVSISPYMETSPANVDDADAPAPIVEGMRRIRWFTTTETLDGTLSSERKVFDGYVVEVEHQNNDLSLSVADLGHALVIAQIEDERVYGSDEGDDLGDVIQQILDDTLGTDAPTLVVDASIGTVKVNKFKQDRSKLMEAVRNLALRTVGANVRYMWRSDADEMELRLFMPPRDKTVADFTFGPGNYEPSAQFREKTDDVRNAGRFYYKNRKKQTVVFVSREVPESVTKYKRRYFEFREGVSEVDTEEEAQRFLDTAILDLALPKAEKQFVGLYNWALEPWDLYTLTANNKQYTSDQSMGCSRVQHSLRAGQLQTTVDVRGNIAGFSRRWIAVEGKGPRPPDDNVVTVGGGMGGEGSMFGGELWNAKPDGAVWPYLFIGPSIKRVHIWHRENAPGVVTPLWPPTSSDMYKAVTLERPEGLIPREGNFVWPSGTPLEGTRAWRIAIPLPTTPDCTAGVIIQAETFEGLFGPQQRYSAVATDGGTLDPGGFATLDLVRIDATTVQATILSEVGPNAVLVFRDGVPVDMIPNPDAVEIVWVDPELHADKDYKYEFCCFSNNNSGKRTTILVPAWSTSLAFATGTPAALDSPTLGLKVEIGWTGLPGGTAKVQIQKSRDSGHYDPWTIAATVDPTPALYYDAVVFAGQFYRLVALDADDAVLDYSLPVYWTNPFG